jgi:hypothetical protein
VWCAMIVFGSVFDACWRGDTRAHDRQTMHTMLSFSAGFINDQSLTAEAITAIWML